MGDLKGVPLPSENGVVVYGYLLTPAHFGLEQVKSFLNDKLMPYDFDFVDIAFECP